jgi:hypothetical protein
MKKRKNIKKSKSSIGERSKEGMNEGRKIE